MIKRTIFFENPAYLSLRNKQLVVTQPPSSSDGEKRVSTVPIEDLGVIVVDNPQVSFTSGLTAALLEQNVALVTCDSKHLPTGMMLPLVGHSSQNQRFRNQLSASRPLVKQLWQQTVSAKIRNQAAVLMYSTGEEAKNMLVWATKVKSGDSDNMEGRAAAYYWKNIFPSIPNFVRGRDESFPNNFLNYGYAVLRAIVARALVSSGLLPLLGINHHNKYNDYCLADDIMEPYRPFVDKLVVSLMKEHPEVADITKEIKMKLLSIPVIDVEIDGHTSPLMVAVTTTTASLYKCFSGECRKIVYPIM